MAKDKRKKGCPNTECIVNQNREKYDAEEIYCSKCGTKLEFVCSSKNCYKRIEDIDSKHRICASCEALRAEKRAKMKDAAKKGAGKVGGAILAVGAIANEEIRKPVVAAAKMVGKGIANRIAKPGVKLIEKVGERILKK